MDASVIVVPPPKVYGEDIREWMDPFLDFQAPAGHTFDFAPLMGWCTREWVKASRPDPNVTVRGYDPAIGNIIGAKINRVRLAHLLAEGFRPEPVAMTTRRRLLFVSQPGRRGLVSFAYNPFDGTTWPEIDW